MPLDAWATHVLLDNNAFKELGMMELIEILSRLVVVLLPGTAFPATVENAKCIEGAWGKAN